MNNKPCPPFGDFWGKVLRTETCWLWQGAKVIYRHNHLVYGKAWHERRLQPAHRVAYQLAYGKIPKGKLVCHACDVPLCVKPDHLWIGTNADNIRDMFAKGRHPSQKKKGPTI